MPTDTNQTDAIVQVPYYLTFEQMNTIIENRWNWLQLALWMRFYINNFRLDSESLPAVSDRLYRGVPLAFYNTLHTFYGDAISQRFLNLLSSHILLFWRLFAAMVSADSEAANTSATELYQNADEIADFLAQINPFWGREQWRILLYQYISLTIQSYREALAGNFERVIAIHDSILTHANAMGDYMAQGIIARQNIN
jgi:hypothetical protein